MAIVIDIPEDVERALRAEWGDLEKHAREDLIVAGYQSGRITAGRAAGLLGVDGRPGFYAWLAERRIPISYSMEDYEQDHAEVKRVVKESKRDRGV